MRRLLSGVLAALLLAIVIGQGLVALTMHGVHSGPPPHLAAQFETHPPPEPPGPPVFGLVLQALVTTGLVGTVLAWLGSTLGRDLARLETASDTLRGGDLTARVALEGGALKPVADRFDAMAEHMQTLVVGQRNLLEAVSHELRTPHARMRFQLEALRDAPPDGREDLIVGLEDDLEQVDALLEELLTSLRLTSRPREAPEPHRTEDTVTAVVSRLAVLHPEIALSARVDGGCPCTARDLQRILENLLTNALRHARKRVEVHVASNGTLCVDDDGAGVAESQRRVIFDSFQSGDPSRSRELGGVGLGLAIVRRAAERWGGYVEVQRSPRGGARFEVRWS